MNREIDVANEANEVVGKVDTDHLKPLLNQMIVTFQLHEKDPNPTSKAAKELSIKRFFEERNFLDPEGNILRQSLYF